MNKRFSKVLSVILTAIMLIAMVSVAFAADAALPGSGTKDDPYQVSDLSGLQELAGNTSAYDGKYIVLTADIMGDSNTRLNPIGTSASPFKGFFDGDGHVISTFRIAGTNTSYRGIFGCAKDAEIGNFTVRSASLICTGSSMVGVVAGYAENTTISNVKTENSSLTAGSNAGGIVGVIKDGSVVDCVNGCSVALSKEANAGGIAGKAENSEIRRCINTAAVTSSKKNVGGIVGSVDGTVSHCLNKGNVDSSYSGFSGASNGIAGIAGMASGEVSFCGNAGSVFSPTHCSGIFYKAGDLSVSYCYNAGGLDFNDEQKELSDTIGLEVADAESVAVPTENCIGVGGDVTADMLKAKDAYEGWDFDAVWYEPGDYHDYPYPMLRDCSFHKITKTSREATCTSAGVDDYSCSTCDFNYFVTTQAALGHQKVLKNTVPANCTVEGEKTYKCKRCGNDLPDETEVLPIDPDAHVDKDNDNVCDLCEKTIKQEETKRTFFQKIGDFFRRIFDWIRNLFKRK